MKHGFQWVLNSEKPRTSHIKKSNRKRIGKGTILFDIKNRFSFVSHLSFLRLFGQKGAIEVLHAAEHTQDGIHQPYGFPLPYSWLCGV